MATPAAVTVRPLSDDLGVTTTGNDSAVSWGAIFVGAAAAASLSLLLVVLGFGLGLSAISPWSENSASAETIGVSTILWIALTQIAASALGGYLAGRLRVKWSRLHTDEVYFRDTAHGFMAWAVATLVTAAFLASAMSAAIGGGVKAGATVAQGIASGAGSAMQVGAQAANDPAGSSPSTYFVNSMFRADPNTPGDPAAAAAAVREATPVVAYDLRTGSMSAADRTYLGQLVAKQTGLSQPDAEKRVSDAFGQLQSAIATTEDTAKQAAEKARKAAAYSALWTFIALLCGAFFASLAATFGGRRRDLFA